MCPTGLCYPGTQWVLTYHSLSPQAIEVRRSPVLLFGTSGRQRLSLLFRGWRQVRKMSFYKEVTGRCVERRFFFIPVGPYHPPWTLDTVYNRLEELLRLNRGRAKDHDGLRSLRDRREE